MPRLLKWYRQAEISDEIEQSEFEIISAPASELDDRNALNASWRWEGAAVLVAALGRFALPNYDEPVDPKSVGDACGLLATKTELDNLDAAATFDPSFQPESYGNQVLALHWRLRQFVHIERESIDFAEFARGVQWASFNLQDVPLVDGDLSIGGATINQAEEAAVFTTLSIVSERHQAANWLLGWDPVYSNVDTAT